MIPITQIKSIVPPTAVPTVWAVVKDGIPEVFGKLIKTDITGDNEAEDVADNETVSSDQVAIPKQNNGKISFNAGAG